MTATFLAGVLLLALAGCAPDPSQNWFSTPAMWGSGTRVGPQGLVNVPAAILLEKNSKAKLTDFPEGTISKESGGGMCFTPSTKKLYTGNATWENVDGRSINIEFGKSHIHAYSDRSGLGDQDWDSMFLDQCGGAEWQLGLICGIPGYGGPGKKEISSQEVC